MNDVCQNAQETPAAQNDTLGDRPATLRDLHEVSAVMLKSLYLALAFCAFQTAAPKGAQESDLHAFTVGMADYVTRNTPSGSDAA